MVPLKRIMERDKTVHGTLWEDRVVADHEQLQGLDAG
jgi:hypothetical protein